MSLGKRHFVLPDVQVKPGQPTEWLVKVGEYCVDQLPDTIICMGDFWDMPSLSSYDVGKRCFEGRRYVDDISAGKAAMSHFMAPILAEQARRKRNKEKQWRPKLIFLLGNHEERIMRAVNNDSKLHGLIGYKDLDLVKYNWEVKDFLEVCVVDGVAYSHYFGGGVMQRPIGTANAMVNKLHMSAIAGHQQGRQVAYGRRADGSAITCIIAGSCYLHDEAYMGSQGNKHWRGLIVLNEVKDGTFDEMFVSIPYLMSRSK